MHNCCRRLLFFFYHLDEYRYLWTILRGCQRLRCKWQEHCFLYNCMTQEIDLWWLSFATLVRHATWWAEFLLFSIVNYIVSDGLIYTESIKNSTMHGQPNITDWKDEGNTLKLSLPKTKIAVALKVLLLNVHGWLARPSYVIQSCTLDVTYTIECNKHRDWNKVIH